MSAANEISIVRRSEEHSPNASQEAGSSRSGDTNGARAVDMNSPAAVRRRLPDERHSLAHNFPVGGQEGYITVGCTRMVCRANCSSGWRRKARRFPVSWILSRRQCLWRCSMAYRCGSGDKFSQTRFELSGWSGNSKIGYAKSLTDYLFRWLELCFLKGEQGLLFKLPKTSQPKREVTSVVDGLGQLVELGDAPPCQFCGSLMLRNNSCYRCMTCGSTSGCS